MANIKKTHLNNCVLLLGSSIQMAQVSLTKMIC